MGGLEIFQKKVAGGGGGGGGFTRKGCIKNRQGL